MFNKGFQAFIFFDNYVTETEIFLKNIWMIGKGTILREKLYNCVYRYLYLCN